jgi:hypothetical protein
MNDKPKQNTEDELEANAYTQDEGTAKDARTSEKADAQDGFDKTGDDETDKYLAMEQPGVTYTHDTNPTENSDFAEYDSNDDDAWSEEGGNSKNSDAFNQDDYILEDNIDLDEDQNQSISSDDEDFEESNERYTN